MGVCQTGCENMLEKDIKNTLIFFKGPRGNGSTLRNISNTFRKKQDNDTPTATTKQSTLDKPHLENNVKNRYDSNEEKGVGNSDASEKKNAQNEEKMVGAEFMEGEKLVTAYYKEAEKDKLFIRRWDGEKKDGDLVYFEICEDEIGLLESNDIYIFCNFIEGTIKYCIYYDYNNKILYEGSVSEDCKWEGKGVLYDKKKEIIYIGDWEQSKLKGKFAMFNKNKEVKFGRIEENQFKEDKGILQNADKIKEEIIEDADYIDNLIKKQKEIEKK